MTKSRLLKYALLGIAAALIAHYLIKKEEKPKGHPRDYAEIAAEGIIHASTEYNSISFYVDDDTLSGFHYELIEAFARDHGLQAAISPEMSFNKRLEGLADGQYDVIAYGILATSELKDSLLLTTPIVLNKQVLVQRKLENISDSSLFIKSQLDLAGKTLHVVKGSPSILRIRNLGNEIGDTIYVEEIEKYGSEQLIALVAHGDIDYAVCDESIARTAADSIPQIDINTAISFTQFYSWGVSKQSPILLDSLNTWLDSFKKGKEYKKIYKRYYGKRNSAALFHTRSISLLLQLVINQQLITAKSCIHFAVPLQSRCSGTAHRYAVRLQQLCSDTATRLQSHCKIHAARMQTRCSHQIPISILRHTRSKELESFHLP